MSAPATLQRTPAPQLALPLWKMAAARSALEIKQFFREKGQVIFTFAMPLLMLVLLASIFKQRIGDSGVDAQQIYVTGMLGVGIMSTSFQSMILQVVGERSNGTLKRWKDSAGLSPERGGFRSIRRLIARSSCRALWKSPRHSNAVPSQARR